MLAKCSRESILQSTRMNLGPQSLYLRSSDPLWKAYGQNGVDHAPRLVSHGMSPFYSDIYEMGRRLARTIVLRHHGRASDDRSRPSRGRSSQKAHTRRADYPVQRTNNSPINIMPSSGSSLLSRSEHLCPQTMGPSRCRRHRPARQPAGCTTSRRTAAASSATASAPQRTSRWAPRT
jgi:hypothetical protein